MKIGEQLQKQRKAHKMSQDTLAKELHISRQSVSKWENGATLPSFSNVIAISELFDVSLDELIKGDEALMDKFQDDKIRFSKTEIIFAVGSIITFAMLAFIYSHGISMTNVDDWMSGWWFFIFIFFCLNVKWDVFNQSLNKKAVFFGILLLIFVLVPGIMHEIPSFLQGLDEGVRSMPYKY